jgi:hypothetical protein
MRSAQPRPALLAMVLVGLAVAPAARAAEDAPNVWVEAGLDGASGLAETPGVGGGFDGGVGVSLSWSARNALGLVVRVREDWVTEEVRQISGVDVTFRWPSRSGPYGFLGLAHHHESLIADAIAHPITTMLGADPTIDHRTGLTAGFGWDFPSPQGRDPVLGRVLPRVMLSAIVLPTGTGPPVYAVAEVGFRVGVGKLPEGQ